MFLAISMWIKILNEYLNMSNKNYNITIMNRTNKIRAKRINLVIGFFIARNDQYWNDIIISIILYIA